MLSAIFISIFAGIFAYLDIETTDKCIGIVYYSNTSVPVEVMKWQLIGESFPVMLLNFWFPATIALLFGGTVFLRRHKPLLYIGLIMGLLVVIYKAYLFIFSAGPNFIDSYKRYPVNLIFLLGLVLSCLQISHATKQSRKSIIVRIGLTFVFSLAMAMSYRYIFVPFFNEQTSEVYKALIAAIIPLFSLFPVAITKYVVLCHSTGIASPESSYILVYFNYLAPVALYRMMQAELTELKYFIAFSLLHGIFYILAQVTRHFRENVWGRAVRQLERHQWRPVPYRSPRNRRLQADLEIQEMLSQFGTLILSQVYMVLYRFSTFDVALDDEIRRISSRIAISLAIEFVFAWLSTLIQIWLYNIAIKTVWFGYWRRHLLANVLIAVAVVSYFSPVLLSVFMSRVEGSNNEGNSLRNCTISFTYHK
ncbi:uncharacterized protein LOC114533330 [Dendronephthya gigantea]|uniref:uncharacterized protein LOC114533330 n=1 Tax=Dendronephthya gigantea TaxID=151771 RepID=UPI00106C2C91|nr:uncharacterized protein LOC114533330 [Dendronephthya gigantea]